MTCQKLVPWSIYHKKAFRDRFPELVFCPGDDTGFASPLGHSPIAVPSHTRPQLLCLPGRSLGQAMDTPPPWLSPEPLIGFVVY